MDSSDLPGVRLWLSILAGLGSLVVQQPFLETKCRCTTQERERGRECERENEYRCLLFFPHRITPRDVPFPSLSSPQ